MGLRYVVITSVTGDDLPNGGAAPCARAVELSGEHIPGGRVEVLIPDLQGDADARATVVSAAPTGLNRNIETVARLKASVRPEAVYALPSAIGACARLEPAPSHKKRKHGLGETEVETLSVTMVQH